MAHGHKGTRGKGLTVTCAGVVAHASRRETRLQLVRANAGICAGNFHEVLQQWVWRRCEPRSEHANGGLEDGQGTERTQ